MNAILKSVLLVIAAAAFTACQKNEVTVSRSAAASKKAEASTKAHESACELIRACWSKEMAEISLSKEKAAGEIQVLTVKFQQSGNEEAEKSKQFEIDCSQLEEAEHATGEKKKTSSALRAYVKEMKYLVHQMAWSERKDGAFNPDQKALMQDYTDLLKLSLDEIEAGKFKAWAHFAGGS